MTRPSCANCTHWHRHQDAAGAPADHGWCRWWLDNFTQDDCCVVHAKTYPAPPLDDAHPAT